MIFKTQIRIKSFNF